MPANMGALNANASAVAQIAASSLQESGKGSNGEAGKTFAAVIQQAMEKQEEPTLGPALQNELADLLGKLGEDEDVEGLQAVLPFLEAMGLAKPATDDEKEPSASEITPLAVPMTAAAQDMRPPAISAVTNAPKASTNLPADTLPAIATRAEDMPPELPVTSPHAGAKDTALSEGREFSSQLTQAIEAIHEEPRQPGQVANAVHEVISNASPRHEAPSVMLPVSPPVGSPKWSDAVGNQIVWMTQRQESRAELVLNPPQMGRVEISLTVTGDHASASFVSANPTVREAIESALPRLREVLADSGIQLGQAQVGAENARQQSQQENRAGAADRNTAAGSGKTELLGMPASVSSRSGLKLGHGLVDVFA